MIASTERNLQDKASLVGPISPLITGSIPASTARTTFWSIPFLIASSNRLAASSSLPPCGSCPAHNWMSSASVQTAKSSQFANLGFLILTPITRPYSAPCLGAAPTGQGTPGFPPVGVGTAKPLAHHPQPLHPFRWRKHHPCLLQNPCLQLGMPHP